MILPLLKFFIKLIPGSLCSSPAHHGGRFDRDQLQLLHGRMGGVDVSQGQHQEPEETHPEQQHC